MRNARADGNKEKKSHERNSDGKRKKKVDERRREGRKVNEERERERVKGAGWRALTFGHR